MCGCACSVVGRHVTHSHVIHVNVYAVLYVDMSLNGERVVSLRVVTVVYLRVVTVSSIREVVPLRNW